MSIHDPQDHCATQFVADPTAFVASAQRVAEDYDDPSLPQPERHQPRNVAVLDRLAYTGAIDSLLAQAGCTPDGYLNLSAAESVVVELGREQGVPAERIAESLIALRREGQLFNVLRASTQIAELQRKQDALLADVTRLQETVRLLAVQEAA